MEQQLWSEELFESPAGTYRCCAFAGFTVFLTVRTKRSVSPLARGRNGVIFSVLEAAVFGVGRELMALKGVHYLFLGHQECHVPQRSGRNVE